MRKIPAHIASFGLYEDADYKTLFCREEEGHEGKPNPVRHRLYRVTTVFQHPDSALLVETEVKYVLAESESRAKNQATSQPCTLPARPVKSQAAELVPFLLQGWGNTEF